ERHDLVGRERALAHDAEDRGAHGPGRPGDRDPHDVTLGRWEPDGASGRTESAPSSKAVCSSRTAVSTCSSRTTHEILIGEVEIISMFTPALAIASKVLCATPGWLFIPAPTTDTLPMCSSVWIAAKPSSSLSGSSA